MAPTAKDSDQALIELFLDMVAAERGAAKNTLAAYSRDLADLSAELGKPGCAIARASTDDLRAYLGSLAKRRFAASSMARRLDRKSTRLNSSHLVISYAVFCLKKKKRPPHTITYSQPSPPTNGKRV